MSAAPNATSSTAEAVQPSGGIDINIDDPELLQEEAGLMEIDQYADANSGGANQGAQAEPVDAAPLRSEAVLLYGVDQMSTDDVKLYASHYSPDTVPKIEWVDDSSVLYVFDSEDAAKRALEAFTSEAEYYDQPPDASALRNAKSHPQNTRYTLKVRFALQTDRKTKWSRERSKYYLFHGDPREKLYEQRRQETRSKRTRRRSVSPEKHVDKDTVEYGRGRGPRNDEDDFPSVLKETYTPITKSWANVGSIDRYGPSTRGSGPSRRRLERNESQDPPRRRSLSPDRRRSHSGYRARDGGIPQQVGDDAIGSNLASRIGAKAETVTDPASDFASRLSVKKDDDKNGGRRRRRAHHLEFD
ncbi:hypothetical protein V1525DRAFT_361196 [Lipomyces kononenkoae]|uniref:Uncharacterized protein n=1 Tax=Lipomyces kononenkoae TaxID=34357 RepID=A0ACC3T049_LIPKO